MAFGFTQEQLRVRNCPGNIAQPDIFTVQRAVVRDGITENNRHFSVVRIVDDFILADSGIRNGLDVVRMIALGADTVLLGRAFLYALATAGQAGVANLLNLIEKEMKVAMTLTGAKSISEITQDSLVQGLGKELPAALAPMAKGNAA